MGEAVIVELGHAGLWVDDLATMRDFYRDVLGLTVTDEDNDVGMVFFSSRPHVEHHELVIARGRSADRDARVLNQLSWRLDSLESLLEFYARLVAAKAPIRQAVTHGIALGVYFEDPEGNVNEVYWTTGEKVTQPYRKSVDLHGDPADVLAEAHRLLSEEPPRYDRR